MPSRRSSAMSEWPRSRAWGRYWPAGWIRSRPRLLEGMSAIWGSPENICSMGVFPSLTPTGPPPGDAERSGGWPPSRGRLLKGRRIFGDHGRPLKPTLHLSVGSSSAGWDSLVEWVQCVDTGGSALSAGRVFMPRSCRFKAADNAQSDATMKLNWPCV